MQQIGGIALRDVNGLTSKTKTDKQYSALDDGRLLRIKILYKKCIRFENNSVYRVTIGRHRVDRHLLPISNIPLLEYIFNYRIRTADANYFSITFPLSIVGCVYI